MTKVFNLLELHDDRIDVRPFSWICFDLNKKTKSIINNILDGISSLAEAISILNFFSSGNNLIMLGDFLNMFKDESYTLYDIQSQLSPKKISVISTLGKYALFLMDCNILERSKNGKAYKYNINNNINNWRLPIDGR